MLNKDDIQEKIEALKDFHQARIREQRIDQTFVDDTFAVFKRDKDKQIIRTGTAKEDVLTISSLIETSNPQVLVPPKSDKKIDVERAERIGKMLNYFLQVIIKQNPHPIRELITKLLSRGEAWAELSVDPDWEEHGLLFPIMLSCPDPMIVYASPAENRQGVPEMVVVSCERTGWLVKQEYPGWSPKGMLKDPVSWTAVWDSDSYYYEADTLPLGGVKPHVMGFTPFIHILSGFGATTEKGKPEDIVVSFLRNKRDIYREECKVETEINHQLERYTFPLATIENTLDPNAGVSQKDLNELVLGPQQIIDVSGKKLDFKTIAEPSQAQYQYLWAIKGRLNRYVPATLTGAASQPQSSGRQEDILGNYGSYRFRSVFTNTETGLSNTLSYVLRILEKFPGLKPPFIKEGDIDGYYDCQVELRVRNPVEDERKLMAGRALKDGGLIPHKEFLVKYAGYTPDEAQNIINDTIIEKTLTSPMMMEIMGRDLLKELGFEKELEQLEQMQAMMKGTPQTSPRGGEPRRFNMQSNEGLDMADMMFRQRKMRELPTQGMGG